MLYKPQRVELLAILEDMRKENLIDIGGGALAVRCNENHILLTTTGASFRRWNIGIDDFIVLDLNGKIVEQTGRLGPAGTPVFLHIFKNFPLCNAIVHSHSGYSHIVSSLGISVPNESHFLSTIGEVPCVEGKDENIKEKSENDLAKLVTIPEGMPQRIKIAAINILNINPKIDELFSQRKNELEKHGMGFLVKSHGSYVFARNIDEACENLMRIETACKTYTYKTLILSSQKFLNNIDAS